MHGNNLLQYLFYFILIRFPAMFFENSGSMEAGIPGIYKLGEAVCGLGIFVGTGMCSERWYVWNTAYLYVLCVFV